MSTSILPKPATYRVVMPGLHRVAIKGEQAEIVSVTFGGLPPGRFKRWLIKKLLGFRIEYLRPGERE